MDPTSFTQTTSPVHRDLSAGHDATNEPVRAATKRSCHARHSGLSLVGRRRRPTGWAAPVALLMVTLIAACTPDPPAPPSQDADNRTTETITVPVPYVDGADAEAEAYRALRLLDPCALLAPDAGAQAVGGTADQLLPGPDPAECTLDVLPQGAQDSVDAWTVSVEVGVRFDDTDLELGATSQPIPGTPEGSFYRQESFSGTGCTIVRPVEDGYGIELEVRAPILAEAPSQPPCDIAIRYLENTTDRWLEPPAHADELTTPRLPLAEQDPCAATPAIADALGAAVRAKPGSLYACRVLFTAPVAGATDRPTDTAPTTSPPPTNSTSGDRAGKAPPGGASPGESVEITFAFTGDPASREPTSGIEPVTIAGRVGSLDRSQADSCVIHVAINDTVRVETEDGDSVQAIGVTAPNCETATQVATTVLETVTDR